MRVHELLGVLLHVVDQGHTRLEDELIYQATVIHIEIYYCEEEFPHAGANLILIIEEFSQAGNAVFNGRVTSLSKGDLNGFLQYLL